MYEVQVTLRCRTSTVIPSNEVPSYLEPVGPDAPKIRIQSTAQSTKYGSDKSSRRNSNPATFTPCLTPGRRCVRYSVERSVFTDPAWSRGQQCTVRLTTNLTGGPRVACPTGYKRGSPLVQYPISLTQVRGRSALTTAFSNVARSSSRQTGGTRLSLDRGLQALEEIYRVIFGEIARAVGLGRRCVAGGSATCVVDLSLS